MKNIESEVVAMSDSGLAGSGGSRSREALGRAVLTVPANRVREKPKTSAGVERARADTASAPAEQPGFLGVKAVLHERLLNEINEANLLTAGEDSLVAVVKEFVGRVLVEEELALNDSERKRLV